MPSLCYRHAVAPTKTVPVKKSLLKRVTSECQGVIIVIRIGKLTVMTGTVRL
jgi:hypothetical protein